MKIAKFDVAALSIAYGVGYCSAASMPLWIAAAMKSGIATVSGVGWLGTGELLATAISILAVSTLSGAVSPRKLAVAAALLAASANIIAMFGLPGLIVGRLLTGLAIGALLATVTGAAARRTDAQRVLAVMQAAVVIVISSVFAVSGLVMGHAGATGLFALSSALAVLTAIVAWLGLPKEATAPPQQEQKASAAVLAPLLGCLGLASLCISQGTIWTYIVAIGSRLGFDPHTVGVSIAVGTPITLSGPIAARLVGERAGLLKPLFVAIIFVGAAVFALFNAPSPLLWSLFIGLFLAGVAFCTIYSIALLGRWDKVGGFASAPPGFIMVGGALGPVLGSNLISADHFKLFALAAATPVALSIALFAAAAVLAPGATAAALAPRQPA